MQLTKQLSGKFWKISKSTTTGRSQLNKLAQHQQQPKVLMERVDKNIYRYGDYSYQVKMMVAGHKVSKVFDTLDEARTWRDLQRAGSSLDLDEKRIFEARATKREARTFTVRQALERYELEVTPLKKGASVESFRIGKAKTTSLSNKSLYMVTSKDVLKFLDEIGSSDNNKRKYASLISHLYRIAVKRWGMAVENPVSGKIEMPSNGKPRDRRLVGNEAALLFKNLSGEAKTVFELAIETSMRRGEILSLEWKHVDLKNLTATLSDTKNGESRCVPLSRSAIKAFKSQKRGIGKGKVFSITKSQLRDAWEAARDTAGIQNIRFHDLRHEATSRLFEKGLNVMEAASVTGHKTLSMLKRYTHLNPTDIAKKLG
jgi:integrase